MKSTVKFLIALSIMGILCVVILPSVNAETFDIGAKISESDLDLRDRKLVYFSSGTTVYTEPDYIDHIASIFDGDESTGINHYFGAGHEVMWIELIFPTDLNVSTITIKPTFGGGATNYSFYVNSNGIWSPWFAEKNNTQMTFQINCEINGIWLMLNNEGTNHFYFNDIIINYTPNESSKDLKNGHDDDLDVVELFIEPPFIGLLWIIVIIALISNIRGRKANETKKSGDEPESMKDQPPSSETEVSSLPEKGEKVGGRFCPSCGKFTEEKGSFCPHCKRSMD